MLDEQCEKIKRFVAERLANPTVYPKPIPTPTPTPTPIRRTQMFTQAEKKLLNTMLKNANSRLKDDDLMEDDLKKSTSELLRSINKKVIESEENAVPNELSLTIPGKAPLTYLIKN